MEIAERRMFAKTIIDSDAFLDMPMSARLLYYDLGMRADDDGFVNSPKKIMRMIGASDDDLRILAARKFIIPFDNGIVVIKHWRINNYLRNDRYNETQYIREKSMLELDDKGKYHLKDNSGIPPGIPTVSTGKDSIGKDSIVKDIYINNNNYIGDLPSKKSDIDAFFDRVWKAYPRKKGKGQISDAKKKYLFKHVGEEQLLRCIDRFKAAMDGKDEQYIMYGSTFFNSGYIDYTDESVGAETEKVEPEIINPDRPERWRSCPDSTWSKLRPYAHDDGSFDWSTFDASVLTGEDLAWMRNNGM